MQINDGVYGKFIIKEPVIKELVQTKPLQRLKGVNQSGAVNYVQKERSVTRFEHSVGVWYLSNLFKRGIEEQVAALIHDTPHTAFSHVIDFVVEDKDHEYHDKFTKKIVMKSEIPAVLKKHKIDINKVLDKKNFELLGNDLPDISFDRLDYFLRDGTAMGFIPKETVRLFLKSLKVRNGKFFFADVKIAGMFAILFMNMSRLIWLDPTSHGSFFVLAKAIKIGLEKRAITEKDFWLTDEEVLKKLRSIKDPNISKLLNRLSPGNEFEYAPKEAAEYYGPNKPRCVDPLVLKSGKLLRVSTILPNLKYYISEFKMNYKYLGVKPVKN